MKTPIIPLDRWIAASLLQKAIRRNHPTHAMRAAHCLLEMAPAYLVRRLGVIVVEDIGPANLPLVQAYLDHVPELMAYPRLTLPWVERMCGSLKSRLLCDLSFVAATHPTAKQQAFEYGFMPTSTLLECLTYEPDLLTRAVLLRCLSFKDVCAWVEQRHGPTMADTLRRARRLGTENMELGLPLVTGEQPTHIVTMSLPPPDLLHGIPTYALEQHTRLGLRAYRQFLNHLPDINLPHRVKLHVVGEILFALESGLLDRESIFTSHENLKPLVWESFTPQGHDASHMAAWIEMVQARLPLLAKCKRQVFTPHNLSLSEPK
ncbi:MAG: hypothetical protein WAZ18_07650 [Alphaproteobacteria bacterium]